MLRKWWTAGEEGAEAVFRARLALPIIVLTMIVLGCYLTIPDSSNNPLFSLIYWTVCAVPFAVRRRRAAIFTKESFIHRPVFGQIVRVPLAGIKRAYWIERPPEEYVNVPLCIELVVGGPIEIYLGVAKAGEVLRRLQAAAEANQVSR